MKVEELKVQNSMARLNLRYGWSSIVGERANSWQNANGFSNGETPQRRKSTLSTQPAITTRKRKRENS